MPSVHGGVDEEAYRKFEEHLLNNPNLDGQSGAVRFCILYTLRHKFGEDL